MRSPALFQLLVLAGLVLGFGVLLALWPGRWSGWLVTAAALGFLTMAVWRVFLILISARRRSEPAPPDVLPPYTILAALYDEAGVVGHLVERLARIDYPPALLQGLLVLEAHDHDTIAAALAAPRPSWLKVLVAPPGAPQTKPRALNYALTHATGE